MFGLNVCMAVGATTHNRTRYLVRILSSAPCTTYTHIDFIII